VSLLQPSKLAQHFHSFPGTDLPVSANSSSKQGPWRKINWNDLDASVCSQLTGDLNDAAPTLPLRHATLVNMEDASSCMVRSSGRSSRNHELTPLERIE
jgi:hypothetical protein